MPVSFRATRFATLERALAAFGAPVRTMCCLGVLLLLGGVSEHDARAQSVSVVPSAGTLSPNGGSISFTVTITSPPGASSIGVDLDRIPVGWVFDSVAGANPPEVAPSPGTTAHFEFAYLNVPATPATFTFTANYAPGLAGPQVFGGIAGIVRPLVSNVPAPDVTLAMESARGNGGTTASDPGRLINVSARGRAGTAAETLIAGFVIGGTHSKPVLLRGAGPSLAAFGVSDALPSVHLDLYAGASTNPLLSNDDWNAGNLGAQVAAVAASVGAFAFPSDSHDAAVVTTLPSGSYTAVVTGRQGTSGVALVEVYDATQGVPSDTDRLLNVSMRAAVGTGDGTLTVGFVVGGTTSIRTLVRAAGPVLGQFGVTGALLNPRLTVIDRNGATVAENQGWSSGNDASAIAAAAQSVGAFAFPASSTDAAVLIALPPGAYTAQVEARDGGTGVTLVELYALP